MLCSPVCSLSSFRDGRLGTPQFQNCNPGTTLVSNCRTVSQLANPPPQPKWRSISVQAGTSSGWDAVSAAKARRLRQQGLNCSSAFLLAGAAVGLISGGMLHEQVFVSTLSLASLTLLGYAIWLFRVHNGMVSVTWHSGRIHIETGMPCATAVIPQHAPSPL